MTAVTLQILQVKVEVRDFVRTLRPRKHHATPTEERCSTISCCEARGPRGTWWQCVPAAVHGCSHKRAVFTRLSTKKALPQLGAAIKPLWAHASANVSNTPVGQRRLRSTDCTRLERLHGENVMNQFSC
jgi:hypothetical protein